MFRITEPNAALADPDCPDCSRPLINILKQMLVKGEVVLGVESAGWPSLLKPPQVQGVFKFIQSVLIPRAKLILEDS
jgi:hypothetical protein